jgi:hypothetical protein
MVNNVKDVAIRFGLCALTPPSPLAPAPLSQAWERLALVWFPDGLARQDRGVGGEGKVNDFALTEPY